MPTLLTEWPPFQGSYIPEQQHHFIYHLVQRFDGLFRTELAATLHVQLGWLRPCVKSKTVECRQRLESLAVRGLIALPERCAGRPRGSMITAAMETPPVVIAERLSGIAPVTLERVTGSAATARSQPNWLVGVGQTSNSPLTYSPLSGRFRTRADEHSLMD